MINDKGILIRNVFYMLSYAFQVLQQTNYNNVATEEFEHAEDLMAAILERGVGQQLKQGLHKEYSQKDDVLPTVRGKINLRGTIQGYIQQKQMIACEYDELSENNIFNGILKTTMQALLKNKKVSAERKQGLKRELLFFTNVDEIDVNDIPWSMLQISRNNRSYEMLINICRLTLEGMLQTTDAGNYRLPNFLDDNMAGLYERFVREYYKQHYGKRLEVSAAEVKWDVSGNTKEKGIKYLPKMRTDIMLRDRKDRQRVHIIDTKYYSRQMQYRFDKPTYHSQNIYQIFAYVKNEDATSGGDVSGMLLYAKTDEDIDADGQVELGGNVFSVRTLDLNRSFSEISAQLDQIVFDYFGEEVAAGKY